jgi:hypothetical protein
MQTCTNLTVTDSNNNTVSKSYPEIYGYGITNTTSLYCKKGRALGYDLNGPVIGVGCVVSG